MGDKPNVWSTDQLASSYAAQLMCLRLLRAGFMESLFVILFVAGLEVALLAMVAIVPTARSPVVFAIALALPGVAAGSAGIFVLLYLRLLRGSLIAAWFVLAMACLLIVVAGLDGVIHLLSIRSAPPAEQGTELLQAATDLLPVYVAVGFAYGSFGVLRGHRVDHHGLLVDQAYGRGLRVDFFRLMGLPIAAADHRPVLVRALGVACLSVLCEGVAFTVYFYSGAGVRPPSLSLGVALPLVVIAWPISLGMLYGLLIVAQLLRGWARTMAQANLPETLSLDRRAPVLFLRSFEDDQGSLSSAPVPVYLRVMDPGVAAHRVEELLVLTMPTVGPVIAIGSPRDLQAPIGAGRGYLGNEQWQGVVLAHMLAARAIVVALSPTEGLVWELEQIRLGGFVHKCLFVVTPSVSGSPHELELLMARAGWSIDLALDPSREPDSRVLAFWDNGHTGPTVVCSSKRSELDYELALRLFVSHSLVSAGR